MQKAGREHSHVRYTVKEKHVKMKSGRKQGYIGHMCK